MSLHALFTTALKDAACCSLYRGNETAGRGQSPWSQALSPCSLRCAKSLTRALSSHLKPVTLVNSGEFYFVRPKHSCLQTEVRTCYSTFSESGRTRCPHCFLLFTDCQEVLTFCMELPKIQLRRHAIGRDVAYHGGPKPVVGVCSTGVRCCCVP